MILFVLVIFK